MPLPQDMPRASLWPTSLAELTPGERLVVSAFRRWLLGFQEDTRENWSTVWNDFAGQLGAESGREALTSFLDLVRGLQGHASRTLYHHQPCCPCLGSDEACLIALVGACQHRQVPLARTLARTLVGGAGIAPVIDGALRLGRILAGKGLMLPKRADAAQANLPTHWPSEVDATLH